MRKTLYSMVIVMDLCLGKLSYCFHLASNHIIYMLEFLMLLNSDLSPYCNIFDIMDWYSWSLYRPISMTKITS